MNNLILASKIARAHRLLHRDLDSLLQPEGSSVEQWRVLNALGEKGGQSMGVLAQNVFMNHPALTKLADRLVSNGLIHRLADPDDQRRVLVHITERGKVSLARLRPIVDEHQNRVVSSFGASRAAALGLLLDELAECEIAVREFEED